MMHLRPLLLATALVSAGLIGHVPVVDASPNRKTVKKADSQFKRGLSLAAEGRYEEALRAFENAYELAPHPLVLFNIAGAHRSLKNYREALDHYSRFLIEGDGLVKAELLARGKKDMDALLALLGRVEVGSQPSGALIFVDGEDMGVTPLSERLILAPGSYALEARLEGYETQKRTIRISSGDELDLDLELVAMGGTEDEHAVVGVKADPIVPLTVESSPRFSLSATFGTNTLEIGTTGAPTLGAAVALGGRLSLGIDVVLVAYSAIPQVRVRVFGDALSMHLIAALPLNMSTGENSEFFVAAAGGAGLRYAVHDSVGLRLEALVSYAGSDRGLTIPAFGGAEVFF